jgi:hypothetical protein
VTLVVGRQDSSGRIRVIGDLRVTRRDQIRRGYPVAVLKNVIVSRDLLVAYAGNYELALHTIRQLRGYENDTDAVLDSLYSSSLAAGAGEGATQYLVGARARGLSVVSFSGVESDAEAAWIGDKAAYEIYQRGYHSAVITEPIRIPGISPEGPMNIRWDDFEVAARMSHGIWQLELEGSVETVGEAFITAYSSRDGFRYEQSAVLVADHDQVVSGDEWVPADWGTAADGGFGYAVLTPTEPGIGLIGLNFSHGRLGLLYHPLARDDPFPYLNVTRQEFRARVLDEHGVDIDGPSIGDA